MTCLCVRICIYTYVARRVGVGIVKALKKKKKESTQIGQLTLQRLIYKADFTGRSIRLFGLSVLSPIHLSPSPDA